MSQHDKDRADLAASKKAVKAAEESTAEIDVALSAAQRTSEDIQLLVQRNGYVDRFRELLRGA